MIPIYRLMSVAWVGLLFLGSGCQKTADPDGGGPNAAGAAYLLNAEPEAAQSVVDARALLEEKKEPWDIVVVGRIDGLGQPTWDPERAAFMIADLSLAPEKGNQQAEHDETPQHDADNCPFCKVKKKKELAGLALIQVVDSSGTTLAVDARQLLGLSEGQIVVVRGEGQVDSLGTLVVRARGIYVRP
ncbi:MAG: hypothetical protein ACYC6N_20570 [Pirellulaceae bacterium]